MSWEIASACLPATDWQWPASGYAHACLRPLHLPVRCSFLGGDLPGLTAALHLATDGYSVTVLEQADQVDRLLLRRGPPPILLEAHTAPPGRC